MAILSEIDSFVVNVGDCNCKVVVNAKFDTNIVNKETS